MNELTGLKEALRIYLAKRNNRKWTWALSIFAFLLIIFSGPLFMPPIVVVYSCFSYAVIIPSSAINFMLPLSDRDLKRKYMNTVLLKTIKIMIYMFLNTLVTLSLNLYGAKAIWQNAPIATTLPMISAIGLSVITGMTIFEDSFVWKDNIPSYKKGLRRISGSIGALIYYAAYFSCYVFDDKSIYHETDGISLLENYISYGLAILLCIIALSGFMKEWHIKDFQDDKS